MLNLFFSLVAHGIKENVFPGMGNFNAYEILNKVRDIKKIEFKLKKY